MNLFDRAKQLVSGGGDGNGPEQTTEERDLANKVKAELEEIRASANRTSHEGIWMTNIAYCVGYDGVNFNPKTRQFQQIAKPYAALRKQRIHLNKILPTLQNRLARLAKNPPKYDVMPESDSPEDKEAARLGIQTLESLWNKLSINEKRLGLYMWVQQTGHAYVKVTWDSCAGNMMSDPTTGEMDFEGEVGVEVVSPFEVFPNPLAKSFDDVIRSWVIQAKVRPLEYFKNYFPEKGGLVKEEQPWLLSLQYEGRVNTMNAAGTAGTDFQTQTKKSAVELIKYIAPSRDRPNGRMIVCAGGILLEDKDLPCGMIPFAKFDDIIIGGKYYSESVTTHLRPLQDYYNDIVRKRSDWTRKMLAGKYKAARGSGIQQESLNDESGELLYYDSVPNAPGGPEALQIPAIPQYAYAEEERVITMFNDVSGISEVSRGQMPSASIPAIGMQLLTEQDDTRIGVMTEQHEHSWARVGKLILKYASEYWTYPRKLKVAGRSLSYAVKDVQGSDFKGNTDVVVIRGSTQPGSKTLKRQEILNTMSLGLLGDPKSPAVAEKVLGMIEFGDVQDLWADYGVDMSQIRRGMDKIKEGQDLLVNKLDNNPLWIVELNRFRKTQEFNELDPVIQGLLERQIQERADSIVMMNQPPPPPPAPMAGSPMDPNVAAQTTAGAPQ